MKFIVLGKYTKQGKEAQLKKIGYNFNQPVEDLIQAELKLADDVLNKRRVLRKPNEIVESVRKGENYVPDFYSKTAKPGPGFEKQLLGRLQSPVSRPGQGGFIATDLIPGATKGSRRLIGGAAGFVLPEVLFYQVDKRNRMSKGQSEKEAAAGALESGTMGAYENKAYMEGLKETAESMGIDSQSFNAAYQLNLLSKNYNQNNTNYEKNYMQLLEMGDEKRADDLKKNFDRYNYCIIISNGIIQDFQEMKN